MGSSVSLRVNSKSPKVEPLLDHFNAATEGRKKQKKKQVDPGLAPSVTSALIRYCVIWSRSCPDPKLSLRCFVSFPVTTRTTENTCPLLLLLYWMHILNPPRLACGRLEQLVELYSKNHLSESKRFLIPETVTVEVVYFVYRLSDCITV